jgi:hypothetical protein
LGVLGFNWEEGFRSEIFDSLVVEKLPPFKLELLKLETDSCWSVMAGEEEGSSPCCLSTDTCVCELDTEEASFVRKQPSRTFLGTSVKGAGSIENKDANIDLTVQKPLISKL